ncbi:TPA: DUF3850 domain-containing protein [Providencia alcalifaciens]
MNNGLHELKVRTEYFRAILSGNKTSEFRKCDGREFKCNDLIRLKEITFIQSSDKSSFLGDKPSYTGRIIYVRITDVTIVNSVYEELPVSPIFAMLSFEVISGVDEKRGLVLI